MQYFFVFLSLVSTILADEQVLEQLECFTTKEVIQDEFPKFTLEGEHTEIVEFNQKDKLKTGIPTCVMFFGSNGTHSATWQGHVSSFALPLECHINSEFYTHCFHSPNPFSFLELPNGWACCCSSNQCNWNNPTFFQFFERNTLDPSELVNRIKPICKYSFCIVFCVFFVVIESILEVLCGKMCGKRKKKSCDEMEKSDEKLKVNEQMSPLPAGDPLKSPLLPSSLKVQVTQSSSSSSKSNKNLSEMSIIPNSKTSLKVDKTQEDDPEGAEHKHSELEPASTQNGGDVDDVVPIPQKPEWKRTKTGRLQKTSMNYEESTYSDLQ